MTEKFSIRGKTIEVNVEDIMILSKKMQKKMKRYCPYFKPMVMVHRSSFTPKAIPAEKIFTIYINLDQVVEKASLLTSEKINLSTAINFVVTTELLSGMLIQNIKHFRRESITEPMIKSITRLYMIRDIRTFITSDITSLADYIIMIDKMFPATNEDVYAYLDNYISCLWSGPYEVLHTWMSIMFSDRKDLFRSGGFFDQLSIAYYKQLDLFFTFCDDNTYDPKCFFVFDDDDLVAFLNYLLPYTTENYQFEMMLSRKRGQKTECQIRVTETIRKNPYK